MRDHAPEPFILALVFGTDAVSEYEDGQRDLDALSDLGETEFYGFETLRDRRMFLLGVNAAIDKWAYVVGDELAPDHAGDVEHVALSETDEPVCPTISYTENGEDGETVTLTIAQHKIAAIRARLNGVCDHPALTHYGTLSASSEEDIRRILDA